MCASVSSCAWKCVKVCLLIAGLTNSQLTVMYFWGFALIVNMTLYIEYDPLLYCIMQLFFFFFFIKMYYNAQFHVIKLSSFQVSHCSVLKHWDSCIRMSGVNKQSRDEDNWKAHQRQTRIGRKFLISWKTMLHLTFLLSSSPQQNRFVFPDRHLGHVCLEVIRADFHVPKCKMSTLV